MVRCCVKEVTGFKPSLQEENGIPYSLHLSHVSVDHMEGVSDEAISAANTCTRLLPVSATYT